jgi:hypothetical protein
MSLAPQCIVDYSLAKLGRPLLRGALSNREKLCVLSLFLQQSWIPIGSPFKPKYYRAVHRTSQDSPEPQPPSSDFIMSFPIQLHLDCSILGKEPKAARTERTIHLEFCHYTSHDLQLDF